MEVCGVGDYLLRPCPGYHYCFSKNELVEMQSDDTCYYVVKSPNPLKTFRY
jgi:hypothetical protein